MASDCYACRLTEGAEPLPGGRLHATAHWVVEHCTGPLGIGTLIVKPFRHCLHVGDLTAAEAQEVGPLLQRVSRVIQTLTEADQVYVCLWSHPGWRPGHIHFVVQPAWNRWRSAYGRPGPFIQAAMFRDGNASPVDEVEAVCLRMKHLFAQAPWAAATSVQKPSEATCGGEERDPAIDGEVGGGAACHEQGPPHVPRNSP